MTKEHSLKVTDEERYAEARSRMRVPRAHDARAVALASAIDCGCETLTQQSFKDEVDINTIVRRFGISQSAPPAVQGVYGDFTGITDFQSAVEKIERARSDFMKLPPEVRERFDNDPGRLLAETAHLDDEAFAAATSPSPPPPSPAPPEAPPVPPAAS